jgi:AcrR family transcriptional regulator
MSMTGLLSSRDRISSSAKQLFARNGYENTSTVAIARLAGTSESQLMKHFGSKLGLLSAIIDQGWTAILQRAYALSSVPSRTPQSLIDVLESYAVELEQDFAMKSLVVQESRRGRRESSGPAPAGGSRQFGALIESLLRDLKNQGVVRADLNVTATRAALFGMMEGLLLEDVLSTNDNRQALYGAEEVRRLLEAFVFALTTDTLSSEPSEEPAPSWTHGD